MTLHTLRTPFQAVLFDLDGTLVDSEAVHLQIWQQCLAPYGVSIDIAQYKAQMAGVPSSQNSVLLVRQFGLSVSASALCAIKEQATTDWLTHQAYPAMPGVANCLAALQNANVPLALVTGSVADHALPTLKAHGWLDVFQTIVTRDRVVHSKPAPDSYLLAAQELGLAPEHCVAIEDTTHGLAAAVAAGMATLVVPTAYSYMQDFSAAHAQFADMGEVQAYLLG